jgi:hypothetical protein
MSAWRRIALAAGISVVVAGTSLPLSRAQEDTSGSGLSISPTRTELSISPGGANTVKINLRNVSGTDIVAKATVNDFESDDETGEPRLLPESDKQNPASIRRFIQNLSDVELKKDEKKDIELEVQVPNDTPPGAYYGAIRYTAVPVGQRTDPGQVALTASVGTLVLIEVPGDITEQIQILSIRALREGKAGSFFFNQPNEAAVRIKNTGNSFSKPFGRVSVTQSGGKEVYSYELNDTDPKSNILPNSNRTFKDKLENIKTPGRYSITANISHGKGGEVLTQRVSFWYVPVWLAAVLGAVLLAVLVGAYGLYRTRFRGRSRGAKKRR